MVFIEFMIYGLNLRPLDLIVFYLQKVNLNLSNHKKYKTYKEQINWKYDIEEPLNQVTTKFNLNLPSYIKKIRKKIKKWLNIISAAQITNSDNLIKIKFA